MRIRSFLQPGVFEPEATAAMGEAFEAACNDVHRAGHAVVMREVIAGRIVAAARFGERDPVRLLAAALAESAGKEF